VLDGLMVDRPRRNVIRPPGSSRPRKSADSDIEGGRR